MCRFEFRFEYRLEYRFECRFDYRFDFRIDCYIAKYRRFSFDNCRSRKYWWYWWYWWNERFFEYSLINVFIENNYSIHNFFANIANIEKWRFVRFVNRFHIFLFFYDSFTSSDIMNRFCFCELVAKRFLFSILKLRTRQLIDVFFLHWRFKKSRHFEYLKSKR